MSKLESAIEIGSTGIRLLVSEINDAGEHSILDRSDQPVSLGRDVFTSGRISRDTLLQCLSILNRFKEQLAGWNIKPDEVTVFATSAFREAKNRDSILDRIMVKTGFRVKVIDGIEENRLEYLAVSNRLKESGFADLEENSIILEAGGGSTEIMLIEHGKIAGAHSMRLGTIIIEQQIKTMMGSMGDARRYITEFINNTKGSLNNELDLSKVKQFIAIGIDVKLAALFAGRPVSTFLWEIERVDFDNFVDEIQNYTPEELIAKYKISYTEAESLHLNLLVYQLFINLTNVKTIIVPETNLQEGIVIAKKTRQNADIQQEFYEQIIASVLNLLHKYNADEKHAQYVRYTSAFLFDELREELGLEKKARMLLEIAALLHDIGTFISASDHNKHSKYIIEHSEIFGMNKDDITVVSQIALWHRGSKNMKDDQSFTSLTRELRLTILKLTAILRIADAIDRAHTQRVHGLKIAFTNDTMTLRTDGTHNNVLEKIAISEKSDLFESVFGYKVVLM